LASKYGSLETVRLLIEKGATTKGFSQQELKDFPILQKYPVYYLDGLLEQLEEERKLFIDKKETKEMVRKTDLDIKSDDLNNTYKIKYHEIPESLYLFKTNVLPMFKDFIDGKLIDELFEKINQKLKDITQLIHCSENTRKKAENYAREFEQSLNKKIKIQ